MRRPGGRVRSCVADTRCAPLAGAIALVLAVTVQVVPGNAAELVTSLEEHPRPPQVDEIPARPRPLVELGEPFLGRGRLSKGWRLPTGAVWRPQLVVFGRLRSAVQSFDDGERRVSEWVNRLDLHANLRLSGTERLLVGLRPLDDDTHFSGYHFKGDEGWHDGMNMQVRTLFFEGDLGEIFPRWDRADRLPLDLGFSVGRQPVSFQDGMLVDDVLDSVGVSKTSLRPPGTSNLRLTALFAWDDVHRGANVVRSTVEDPGGRLVGLFAALDLPSTTLEIDAIHVGSDEGGDGVVAGLGATQRFGRFNSTLRLLASEPLGREREELGRGRLLFSELSWSPWGTHDIVYWNAFVADGRFTSAARDPDVGGPLGRTGILFDAAGMGRYASPLSSAADDAVGFSLGWQTFAAEGRRQLVLELGGRQDTDGSERAATALGARFQQALGRRMILQIDGFLAAREQRDPSFGGRLELQVKF